MITEDQVIRTEGDFRYILSEYDSLEEFADAAVRRRSAKAYYGSPMAGEVRKTADEAKNGGWEQYLAQTLDIAESAVTFIERMHLVDSFQPVFDVAGSNVDVARFNAGEPECMVDYPLQQTSKLGRVIAFIASTDAMGNVTASSAMARGQILTAAAIALERLGHSTEFWVDMGASFNHGEYHSHIRVKGPDEMIDPAKLLFAYGNAAMLHHLQFACENGNEISNPKTSGCGRGSTRNVLADHLPADMIVVNSALFSNGDISQALIGLLKHIGLIEDDPELEASLAVANDSKANAAGVYCDCKRGPGKHADWCDIILHQSRYM